MKIGFKFNKKTPKEIYNQILDNNPTSQIYPFKDFLYDIVDNLKASNKRDTYKFLIERYINNSSVDLKEELTRQYYYIQDFYKYYQARLFANTEEYGFDFSDMIYYANKYIEKLKDDSKFKYEYIIIDEYQYISSERYMFTKKISSLNGSKVVAVGDDWQSIFAFSGSKIEYVYNFSKWCRYSGK